MGRRLRCLTKPVGPADWRAGTTCEGVRRRRTLLHQLHDDRRRDTLRIDRIGVAGDLPLQPPLLLFVLPFVMPGVRHVTHPCALRGGYRPSAPWTAYDCRPAAGTCQLRSADSVPPSEPGPA